MSDYTIINSLRYEKTSRAGKLYYNGDNVFPFYTKDGVERVEQEPKNNLGYDYPNYVTTRLLVMGPVEVVDAPEDDIRPERQ